MARRAGEPLQIVRGFILKRIAAAADSYSIAVELGEEAIVIAREFGSSRLSAVFLRVQGVKNRRAQPLFRTFCLFVRCFIDPTCEWLRRR